MSELDTIVESARSEMATAGDVREVEALRVHFLGKQGLVTAQLKSLGKLAAQERPAAGKRINEAKHLIDSLIRERRTVLERSAMDARPS
jgi:phenylalanyl-tRNA synthetase alpha chain